jgi:hypothetical protein
LIRHARLFLPLSFVMPFAGFVACQPKADPPAQTAQQYPPGQYPPGQYPPGQYPPQPYPTQQQPPQPYPQPPQPYPQPQPTYAPPAPQPTTTQPLPAPPSPQPSPSPAPAPTNPFPFPQPPAPGPAGGAATAIDPNFARVATVPLFAYAATEAAGMSPEGPLVAGQFQQGQMLETPVTLNPNKCYTVLAVGAGIQEVDITLVLTTPVPGMNPTLARDSGGGMQSSLGGKGNCFPWRMPIAAPAKFVITATKGAGIAAGQMYVK